MYYLHKCLLSITYKINRKIYKKKYIKICIYVKIVIPLHRQTIRTSNNIKHINSMNALELRDLKEGNVYEMIDKNSNYITYINVLNVVNEEDVFADFVCVSYDIRGNIGAAKFSKGGYLPNKNLKFKKTTREKFNTVVSQLKDSLTF